MPLKVRRRSEALAKKRAAFTKEMRYRKDNAIVRQIQIHKSNKNIRQSDYEEDIKNGGFYKKKV